MKVGSCKASHRRYYFNSRTRKCEPFYYGGCQGNENQFENKQNCIDSCGATREERVGPPGTRCQSLETCNIKCKYGYATDSKGCSTCSCREDPCKMSGCPSGCKPEWLCTTAGGQRSCDWAAECFDRDAVCREPRKVGRCRAAFPRYHYNHTTGTCERFIYGGCNANNNNFMSEDDCMKTCQGVGVEETKECKAVQCHMNCPYGLETDKHGCHICKCKRDPCLSKNCPGGQKCKAVYAQCLKPPCDMVGKCIAGNTCELAADKGPCKASLHRWYHNMTTQKCERFIYGGCDGNDNNFLSTLDCESTCIRGKPSCPTVMCAMDPCPYGLKTDASGCSVCECRENPCKGFTCASGQICKVSYPQCLVAPCDPVGSCVNGDICSLPQNPGNCRGFIQRWYYNEESGSCEEFTYTGCGGNDNNFMSKHDCQHTCGSVEPQCPVGVRCPFPCEHGYELDSRGCQSCVCKPHPCENHQCPKGEACVLQEVQCVRAPCPPQPTCQERRVLCSLPPEPGMCRALIPRYFYNQSSNQCERFNYGGCRGNNNNFKTHFMCDKICGDTFCKRLHCERYCPLGLARDGNNCPVCKCMPNPCAMKSCSSRDACLARRVENCQQPPCPYEAVCSSPGAVCLLPKEPGRCRASMTRYFYNKTSQTCQEFTYTGCNGNDNNFEHKEQCQSYCSSLKMCPMCFMQCNYGFEMKPDGCPDCKCKEDPCKDPDVCGYKKCVVEKTCMGFGVNRHCGYKRKCIAPVQSCKLPEDPGYPQCGLKEERYSYNPVNRKCQKFTWSGCLGNSNNFYNEHQCNRTCGAVTGDYLDEKCPMVMCMMFCEFGFATDERNCPICQCNPHPCQTRICPVGHTCIASTALCDSTPCPVRSVCVEPQSACKMAPQYGECNTTRRRFTYNTVSKQCQELRYGGCGGNHNNFLSQQECQHVCGEKVACKECSNTCDFGYVMGEGGCPTCQCNEHPCKLNTCGDKPCVAEKKCVGFGSRRECEWRARCIYTDNVCQEPMEKGDPKCALREWRFYYHQDKQKCMKFMYTGCGGNSNNFFSEQECNNTCIAAPKSTCSADKFTCKTSRECIPNTYVCDEDEDCEDGSDEDEDMCSCNAPSDFECEEIFQCVSKNVTCNGKKDCQDGTDEGDICTRRLLPAECQEEKDPGTSGADQGIRYYYASSVGNCFPFAYNGGGGNLNRFRTRHECLCFCTNDSVSCSGGPTEGPSTLPPPPQAPRCPELDCPQECSHGSIRDKDYCPTCDCHPNPCQDTSCESGCKGEYGCSMKDDQRICGWTAKCFNAETGCQLPVSRGTCGLKTDRFLYNTTSKRCERFTYGGCGANENNFEALADCQASCEVDAGSTRLTSSCENHQCPANKKCVLEAVQCVRPPCSPVPACKAQEDICTQPPETGRCRAAIPRYFYNSTASQCQRFVYGGCGGNFNHFKTLQACSSTCGSFKVKDCGDTYCEKYCEFGLATDTNGCQICKCKPHPCMLIQCARSETCILKKDASCTDPDCPLKPTCVSPVEICKQPKEVGPCKALMPRYYYNSRSSQCELFNYGGCRGNDNNFETEKQCNNMCSSQKLCPMCAMMCPYGFPMKPDGCPECKCREDPCKDPRVCHGSQMCVADKTCKGFGMNKRCYWHHRCIQPGLTCLLGREEGNSSCLQNQQRYHYDASSQTCKAFTYSGCHGNSNNFQNMEECGRACRNVKGKLDEKCPLAMCFMFCEYGFARDERGCTQCKCNPHPCKTRKCAAGQTCVLSSVKCKDRNCPVRSACVDASETCRMTMQYGSCRGTVRRMFYNISAQQCQPFTYSGCGGNHNNFLSTKECQETCAEDKRTPCRNTCRNKCTYGYRLNEDGCPTCECRENPCQVNSCGSGSYCVADRVCRGYGDMRMCHAVAKCVSRTACSLPVMLGNPRCGPQEHRFYFNRRQGKCQPFMYSGCEGNSNSFYFQEDCNRTCIDHCPPVCRMWCPFGKKKNHKGCEVCQCKQHACEDETCPSGQKCKTSVHCMDKARKYCAHKYECVEPSKVCKMNLDVGLCKMAIPRWFYNAASGKCENFTYGGCGGNKNNFYQQRECEETCQSIPTPRSPRPGPAGGLTGSKLNLTSISYPMGCSVPRTPGLCIDQCVRDQDCIKGYSCCSNGCGHVCTRLQELKLPPPCHTALEEALLTAVYKPNVYLPRCDKAGFYEEIQCSDHLGVCWCVHPENGFRIAGTQVKGKPDCSGTEDEPVCPDGEDVHDCSPALCMKYPCMAHKGIWCRVNPCGNCSVEFYDANNNQVDPQMDDLRACEMKRSSMLVKKTVLPALGTSSMMTMKQFLHWRQCCSHAAKDFKKCMWMKGDKMGGKKMKLAEDFDACTDTVSATDTPAPVISGVFLPQCDTDLYSSSSYKYRQCQGGFCWCVTSNGTFIAGTMTLRNKCLKCGLYGREVGSSEVYTCPYGDKPHLTCQDACSKEKCIIHGEAKQYHCTADPCNSCRTTFRDDQGQAVNCNEIKPIQVDMCTLPRSFGTCQASITRWYYDSFSGTCRMFLYTGCGGNANNFLSLAECMLACEAKTKHSCKGASVQNPECNNVCRFATCQMFPEALCVTNPCSCEPEFIHPKTGRAVNCSESIGLCERMQAHEMAVYMKEGQQAKPDLQVGLQNMDISKCDHSGDRFRPSQCRQGVCKCVDERGKPTTELHEETGSCSMAPVIKYRGKIIFVAKFSEHIMNGGTIGFSRVVTAKMSAVGGIPGHLIRVVAMWGGKLRDDDVISVMIDIDIREGKADHILSRVDVVERMIRKGMFSVSHRGEVVYADSNSTSHTYTRDSKHDPEPVKKENMENKDLIPTIAVAASAAGVVLLIILGLCCFVWCRSGKKKEGKEFSEVGTN